MNDFGVYIHIPFCKQKCFYCDFPSFAGRERYMDQYLVALAQEFSWWQQAQQEPQAQLAPRTIYIGGGTPTALSCEQLHKLLLLVQKYFSFAKLQEYTVEVNPGTVADGKLSLMYQQGVNRLSIGVQSFNDELLRRIGRIHTGEQAKKTVQEAQKVGFENISIDLMYGLPQQNMAMLQQSLEETIQLGVQHVSIYGLQVEEGTVFARQQELGKLPLPTEEASEAMYDYIVDTLPQYGFHRYEISNFAQDGFASKHNQAYWQDIPYQGFGAGAHSYGEKLRRYNVADIATYIEKVQQKADWQQVEEVLGDKEHMEEFCFLALRTSQGIDGELFQKNFHQSLQQIYGAQIDKLVQKKLVVADEQGCRLTALGAKFGNQVFEEFLL